jgi:hypothetical protein
MNYMLLTVLAIVTTALIVSIPLAVYEIKKEFSRPR